jgi:transposase
VLLAAQGKTNREIAAELGLGEKTAGKWRRRFHQDRVRGLRDAPRKGRPPIYFAEQKAWFLQKAVESARDNGVPITNWSATELVDFAKRAGLSPAPHPATLARWLNRADLQPHRWRYWLQITDPDFETRMKDVTGLYLRAIALHKAGIPVFCVDEKTGIQALERDVPDRPLRPGKPVRREHRYKRRGTACLLGVFQVATGKVWGRFTPNRTAKTVAALLTEVCESVPDAPEIHFVMDQASTHWHLEVCRVVARLSKVSFRPEKLKTGAERKAFLLSSNKRVVFHFTPRRASWLDQIEIWFSVLTRKVLDRGSFTSVADLQAKVYEYIDHYNRFEAHPYRWTYTGTPCRS